MYSIDLSSCLESTSTANIAPPIRLRIAATANTRFQEPRSCKIQEERKFPSIPGRVAIVFDRAIMLPAWFGATSIILTQNPELTARPQNRAIQSKRIARLVVCTCPIASRHSAGKNCLNMVRY